MIIRIAHRIYGTASESTEKGSLDSEKMKDEVLEKAETLVKKHKDMGAILLECSLLPPYARDVAEKTGLRVFDYLTIINFVFSAVVKKTYSGCM